MKIVDVWNIVKNVLIVYLLIFNILIIVLVTMLFSHSFSLNIKINSFATTTEPIAIQDIPTDFKITKKMTISGNSDIILKENTTLPVRVELNIPFDIQNILDKNNDVHLIIKSIPK